MAALLLALPCRLPLIQPPRHRPGAAWTQIMTRRSKPTDRPVWICGLCIHTWENIVFTMPDQTARRCIAFALATSCLFFSVPDLCPPPPRFLACKCTGPACLYSESRKERAADGGFCRRGTVRFLFAPATNTLGLLSALLCSEQTGICRVFKFPWPARFPLFPRFFAVSRASHRCY